MKSNYGEIAFANLFSIIDREIEARRTKLLGGVLPTYEAYVKEASGLKAVETLRNTIQDYADKVTAQNEED